MYIKLQGSNELLAFSGLNDRLAMPGANDQQQGPQSKLPDEPRCVEAEMLVVLPWEIHLQSSLLD